MNAEFYDNYSFRLDMRQFREDAEWKVESLLSVMPTGLYESVLEVGCGPGFVLKGIADAVGARARVGIDISPKMLELASREQGLFIQADVEQGLAFCDKEFELVILSDILEHVRQPDRVIKEAIRVGRDVAAKIPAERALLNRKEYERHQSGHLHNWSRREVEAMLRRYGFTRWRVVEPPARIQFRNRKIRWTFNPLYWGATGLGWSSWAGCRPLWRAFWGTTVVAFRGT